MQENSIKKKWEEKCYSWEELIKDLEQNCDRWEELIKTLKYMMSEKTVITQPEIK